jgi:Mrp family chromosome partitioning ATPase
MLPAFVSLLDRQMLFVTGKGGVGKTTVTAALALAAARSGRRTIVCELAGQARIPALLGAKAGKPARRRRSASGSRTRRSSPGRSSRSGSGRSSAPSS